MKYKNLLPLTILILLVLSMGLPTVIYPFGRDQGTLAYIGSAILKGQIPHRDTWDQKPPGVPYLYALAFSLFGKSMETIRAFDLLYNLLAVLLLFKLVATFYHRISVAFMAGLFYSISYFIQNSYFSMAHVDGFLNLPLTAAAYTCYLGQRHQGLKIEGRRAKIDGLPSALNLRSSILLLLSGLFCSLAFAMKYLALFVLLGLSYYLLIVKPPDLNGPLTRRIRCFLNPGLVLIGFILGLFPLVLYLFQKGALYNLLETQWVFNAGYTRLAFQESLLGFFSTVLVQLNRYIYYKAFFSVLAVAALVYCLKHQTAENQLILIWFSASLLGVILQAKFYHYHWMLLLAPLSVLSAIGFDRLFRGFPFKEPWFKSEYKMFALSALFILILPTVNSYYKMSRTFIHILRGNLSLGDYYTQFGTLQGDFSFTTTLAVVDYLQQKTTPEEMVYIWGFEPLVNFLAGRSIPTRYTYNVPLVAPWGKMSWRKELMQDLTSSPPRYIIVVENDAIPWTTGRTEDSKTLLEEFPELKAFLKENYYEEKKIDHFTLHRLNSSSLN